MKRQLNATNESETEFSEKEPTDAEIQIENEKLYKRAQVPTVAELTIIAATLAQGNFEDPGKLAKQSLRLWWACKATITLAVSEKMAAESPPTYPFTADDVPEAVWNGEPAPLEEAVKFLLPKSKVEDRAKWLRNYLVENPRPDTSDNIDDWADFLDSFARWNERRRRDEAAEVARKGGLAKAAKREAAKKIQVTPLTLPRGRKK